MSIKNSHCMFNLILFVMQNLKWNNLTMIVTGITYKSVYTAMMLQFNLEV